MIDRTDSARRFDLAVVAVVGLSALLLRIPGHLDSGLWYDEIWLLIDSVRVDFGTMLTTFESDNNHPFYSLLAWISVHALGEHPWTLRLPALLFGVASVMLTWKFALRVASRGEAALVTALLAISYHHVWFSQNARGYTMLLFWTLAATYFLLRVYETGARREWVLYGVCLALATYTHASAVLVAVAHAAVSGLVLVLDRERAEDGWERRWSPFLGLALAGLLSLALHAAMLGDMLAFFMGGTAQPAEPISARGPSEWTTLFWTVSAVVDTLGVPRPLGWSALALGGALVLIGSVVCFRRDWRSTLLYILPGVVGVAVTVALGRSLRPRFLFHLATFGLLIVTAGVFYVCEWSAGRLGPRSVVLGPRLKTIAGSLMIAASLVILPKAYRLPKQDFEGALAYARAARARGVAVATTGLTTLPYRDYYDAGFAEVSTVEDLDVLLDSNRAVYVLHTIPIYLESTAPELAQRLAGAEEVARFPGSLGDGDVVVLGFEGSLEP